MTTKILDVNAANYSDHVIPIVNIPADIKKYITDEEIKQLEQACLDDYAAAKKCLDESIADVASKHEKALEFAGVLATRVLTLMDIAATSGLDSRVPPVQTDRSRLHSVGVDQKAIETRAEDFLKELNKGVLKRIALSGSEEIERGYIADAGYVGMNSLAIQHAAEGNLRERMYIPYKAIWTFTKDLLSDSAKVDEVNKVLKKTGFDWQLNVNIINELKLQSTDNAIYQLGAYAASRAGSRTNSPDENRLRYQEQNPTMKAMETRRVPLSQRELLVQSGDLDRDSEKKLQWLPGEGMFGVVENPDSHPSLKAAKESRDLMLTGISGATDYLLTLSHMLGLFNGANKEKKMRDGVTACLGWMIDSRDHTAHEILTSAKSFGLNYTPGPDSYRQIRPGDSQFEKDLRAAQQTRGHEMPDEVLSESHIRQKAREIFPDLGKKKIKEMKALVQNERSTTEHSLDENTLTENLAAARPQTE